MTPVALKHTLRRMVLRLLRLTREEEGAVMVEFTIVAPLFLFLIVGSIQLMSIYHADTLLQYSNFMAVRTGIVHYENIEKGLDPNRTGSMSQALIPTMERAGRTAMGPFAMPNFGFEDLASRHIPGIRDFGIDHSPAVVLDLRVTAGVVDVRTEPGGSPPSRYLDKWLTSETEIDLGLGIPWVGRVIAVIARGASTPTDRQMVERGLDPFSNVSEPFGLITDPLTGLNFMTMRSDSLLDLREENTDNREVFWPLRGRTISTFNRSGGGSATINNSSGTPHPMALPIQRRFAD